MNTWLLILPWIAGCHLVLVLLLVLRLAMNQVALRKLGECPPADLATLPTLSIVVAARNEARDVEAALESWFRLDYPGLELIVVNDRSTDDTGAILDRMARDQPMLQVVHLQALPDGWLGKNHALQLGAERSDSEYLLFTDADVIIQPQALRRAVAHMRDESIDHLTVTPQVAMPTRLLEAFVTVFTTLFFLYFRAWKVSDPASDAHVGIGAFNLLRREAYRECGMHQPIAMRPDDDVKLGKIVKQHGFSQALLVGTDQVYVRWYASVKELMVGLEKNALAGLDYRLGMVWVLTFVLLAGMFAPWVAVCLTAGVTQVLYGLVLVVLIAIFLRTTVEIGVHASSVFWFPVVPLLFIFIIWRATILTYTQGGIRWRDTFYALEDLRKNQL